MTLTTATPLEAALSYAGLGWPVVPLHTPKDGVCDCPKRAECPSPGKHPRTMHGLDDATTDETKISMWWGPKMWPHANIGIDLAKANLVDVAPDSLEWQAEFIARGLPRTPAFRSGGGDGHEHHLFRRPEVCPPYRLCRTDEFDVLSAGYAVMPPSLHVSGLAYAWTETPENARLANAPIWAVQMLRENAKRPAGSLNGTGPAVAPGEPPVQLHGEDLRVWRGELVKLKPGGTVDRSMSLWDIGCTLSRAGATRQTIAHALQERDESLGWSKYTGRRDAQTRYLVLADRVLSGQGPRIRLKPNSPAQADPLPSVGPWPEPENRGKAELSEQGNVEYVEDLVKPGRIIVWAAEEGSGKSYTVDGELAIRLVAAGGSLAGTWPIVGKHRVLVLSEMHSDDDYEREDTVLSSLGLTRLALDGTYWRLPLMTAAHGKPCLQVPEWCSWCVQWCKDKEIKLLIVDTATGATDVNPWGHEMQAVYRQLRLMLDEYPELAIILIVHCKKPQAGASGDRRITDVIGEWGRWCDVIVMQERENLSSVKLTTYKRVRHMRKIVATQHGGLLVDPIAIDASAGPKVPLNNVMTIIVDNPGLTHQGLADLIGVSKRTASKYADEAEKKGLVYHIQGEKATKRIFATAQVGNTAQ